MKKSLFISGVGVIYENWILSCEEEQKEKKTKRSEEPSFTILRREFLNSAFVATSNVLMQKIWKFE